MNGVKVDEGWDIDHVAVGPAGVLVIESKWSGHPWPINGYGPRFQESQMANAAAQACCNANSVQTRLPGLDRTRVLPVGVFWSGAKPYGSGWMLWRDKRTVLVHGRSFREWMASLPRNVLDEPTIENLLFLLETITLEGRGGEVSEPSRSIPSLRELASQWAVLAPLGGLGALLMFGLAVHSRNEAIDLIVPAVAICIGMVGRRYRILRGLSAGWLIVAIPTFMAVAVVAIYFAVR